jgi:hypothetical protein
MPSEGSHNTLSERFHNLIPEQFNDLPRWPRKSELTMAVGFLLAAYVAARIMKNVIGLSFRKNDR